MRATAGVIVALVTAVAMVFAAGSSAADKDKGEFVTLQAGRDAGLTIDGKAEIKRTADGTLVKIVVRGLQPGTTYSAHLHNAPCSADPPGGGHYRNHPQDPGAPPNELWISSTDDPAAGITANPGGVAHGRGSATWVARPEAQSVVVHGAGGARFACADLD
jgi:Cu/Zn superoxide dismutase